MKKLTYSAFVLAGMLGATTSHAIVVFDTGFEYSGSVAPTGPTPWTRTTIANSGVDTVTIKLENLNLVGSEFASKSFLNLRPGMNAAALSFGGAVKVGTFNLPSISLGTDAFKAGPDGYFDILFGFASGNAARFGAGESVTYTVSGISGLDETDFDFASVNGPVGMNGFTTAWHIQSIGAGADSGWIAPVPEPGSFLALGAGLLLIRRRRSR